MKVKNLRNIIVNKSQLVSSVLNVKTGQKLSAQVIGVKGNDILLKIGSRTIEAKAQTYVKEGQTLRLLVDGLKFQEIRLKIINEDSTALRPEQSILKAMGYRSTEKLEDIIRHMVKYRLPLDISNTRNWKLPQLEAWLKTFNIDGDTKSLLKLNQFFKGELDPKEEAVFFKFLNARETQILGNYNIYGWPILGNHIYLLTQNSKKEKTSPGDCFLVLKISSEAAGDLWFKIDYKNNFLKVDISCPNKQAEMLVNNEVKTLYIALIGAGYSDAKIFTKVEKIDNVLDYIPGPNPEDINYVNLQA